MKKILSKEQYKLLRKIDFTELKDEIVFNDEKCEFETTSPLFDVIFDEYIVANGLTEDQNECTDYGKQLYKLYDEIFYGAT